MPRPANITISIIKRNQRLRGPTSSDQQNAMQDEIIRDLSVLQDQWNNSIVELCSIIPAGIEDTSIDAFLNGLDGQTLYVKADAIPTASLAKFYNTSKTRPNTVYEQFVNVYDYIDSQIAELRALINGGG